MPLTRQFAVTGHDAYVFDSELSTDVVRRLYHELAYGRQYSRSEAANAERFEIKHWAMELEAAAFMTWDVGQRTLELVSRHYPGEGQRAFRVYCNLNVYGDALSIHRDCGPGERDVTALWFVSDEWERDWRGDLLFFDQDDDAVAAVTPRPGRLCLFRGLLPHAGTPPSRLCYKPRLTLVCKFSPAEARPEEPARGEPAAFDSVASVFEHMARRIDRLDPRDFEASYRFVIDGSGGGIWRVELTRGGGLVTRDDAAADLTITTTSQTLLDIVNRRVGPARAFVLGRIKAKGNLELVIHLRAILGPLGKAEP